MLVSNNGRKANTSQAEAQTLLDNWHFVVQGDGCLLIQPLRETLTAEHVAEIIARLRNGDCAQGWKEIVFDLRHVERIGQQWTAVLAMFIDFARDVAARCRLASLTGQPAAVAELYRRNPELMDLIAA